MLSIPGHWVWDFWIADDGDLFHAFFLQAPHALGDEHRRHRHARIGHATSADLVDWTVREPPFAAGAAGDFDETATWTGSVVRDDAGLWWMFYTGARFLDPEPRYRNIETVGAATSPDLVRWTKHPGPVAAASPVWYETEGTSGWKEEAWRDPWVFPDPAGDGWHMLTTARADHGELDDRGVLGHATSPDLHRWTVAPPLTEPGAGYGHLEVPQVVEVDGSWFLLFSCPADSMSARRARTVESPGTWSVAIPGPLGPFDLAAARPLTDSTRYSGRLVRRRDGSWVLLAFENDAAGRPFPGVLADPVPVAVVDGRLELAAPPETVTPAELRPALRD